MISKMKFNPIKRDKLIISILSFLIIWLVVGKGLGPELLLKDRFHEGELFANAMEYIGNGSTEQRGLPIHGLLDILPSILTSIVWGNDHHFIPTYAFLKFLDFISALLLVLIASRLTSRSAHRLSWLLVPFSFIAPFLVGSRDLMLLLSLFQFIYLIQGPTKNRSVIVLLLFGSICAIALFYCYDRGIASTVALGISSLYLAWFERRVFYAIISFFGTVLLLLSISDLFAIDWYLRNIEYLVASSPEWRYDWTIVTIVFTTYAVLLNSLSLFMLWSNRPTPFKRNDAIALIIALTALSFFMLKIGINRADSNHIFMASWVPCLILMFLGKRFYFDLRDASVIGILILVVLLVTMAVFLGFWSATSSLILVIIPLILIFVLFDFKANRSFHTLAVAVLTLACITLASGYILKAVAKRQYAWIMHVWSPPLNEQVSEPSVRWVTNELLESGAQCVFDMSNNGLINGLSLLPSCSRFTYPIYAAPQYEDILINDLARANPPAIIYSSDYWSYKIDGFSMKDRYENLDIVLRRTFPVKICSADYCIRKKH